VPLLSEHRVHGKVVVAGACHISALLGAAALTFGQESCILEDILFPQALVIPNEEARAIQVVIVPEEEGDGASFKLISLEKGASEGSDYTLHASGKMRPTVAPSIKRSDAASQPGGVATLEALKARCQQKINSHDLYETLRRRQIDLGPSFQWVSSIWKGEREMLAQLKRPDHFMKFDAAEELNGYQLHPGLIDSCLHFPSVTLPEEETIVPFSLEKIKFYGRPQSSELWCHVSLHEREESQVRRLIETIQLFDDRGQLILEATGFTVRKMNRAALQSEEPWQDWLYEIAWQPQEPSRPLEDEELDSKDKESGGNWLIFADSSGIGERLAAKLAEKGGQPTLVYPAEGYSQVAPLEFQINPDMPSDYQRLMAENWHGVVHLWSLDASTDELEAANKRVCGTTLHLVQALLKANLSPRLTLVTQGAQATNGHGQTQVIDPTQATLWGMGKVIGLEHPEFSCVRVDLDPNEGTAEDNVSLLLDELLSEGGEEQVAFRDQSRYVARLVKKGMSSLTSSPRHPVTPSLFRDDRSYLITGGLGGLGLLVANFMVERGVRHLVLLARSQPNEAAREQVKALEQAGAKVVVAQADVSKSEQLAQVISEIEPPLAGVIHAAGVLADGVLGQQTWEQFEKVFAAKVQGAWNLHTIIEGDSLLDASRAPQLDFFVLFSSAASLLGSPGQANYAAANAFMDALAFYRRAQGLAGLSINWGAWAEIGVAAKRLLQLESKGLDSIAPQQGLHALEALLLADLVANAADSAVQVGVVPINWSQSSINGSFFVNFKQANEINVQQQAAFRRQLDGASADERFDLLETHVRGTIAKILGWSDEPIPLEQGFFDIGMDSLTSVELRNDLQRSLGCRFSSTLLFDYPTPKVLVDYLAQELLSAPSDDMAPEQMPAKEEEPSLELEQLSDDEIGELMDDKLAALDKWLD